MKRRSARMRPVAERRLIIPVALIIVAIPILSWDVAAANAVPDPAAASTLIDELQRASDGHAKIAVSAGSGEVTFMGASDTHPLAAPSSEPPSVVARDFMDRFGALFGVANPSTDLTQLSVVDTDSPVSAVRFQQHYHGLPVFAGEIAVQIAVDGSVLSTSGEAMGAADVDVAPTVSANAATDTARNLAAKYDGVALESLSAAPPELWVYDPSLIGANGPPQPRLVWRIDVRTELGDVDRLVLIDAHSGSVALQFSQRENALNRSVCNNNNNPALPATCVSPVRTEGAPPL